MPLTPFGRTLIESHLMVYPGTTVTVKDKALRDARFFRAFDGYLHGELWPALRLLEYKPQQAREFKNGWDKLATSLAAATTGAEFMAVLEGIQEYLGTLNKGLIELAEERERERLSYFDGTYRSAEHTTALLPLRNDDLVSDHKNKHFQGQPGSDAQYSRSKGYVAALEAKAVRLGIAMKGDIYFIHNEEVGWLGSRHGKAKSRCIRVDAPGGDTQHSHPFPESLSGSSDDSHDSLLADVIVDCAVTKDIAYLGRIAKYLADVGGHTIGLNAEQKRKTKGLLPKCEYW